MFGGLLTAEAKCWEEGKVFSPVSQLTTRGQRGPDCISGSGLDSVDKLCLYIFKGDAVIITCSDKEEEDQRGCIWRWSKSSSAFKGSTTSRRLLDALKMPRRCEHRESGCDTMWCRVKVTLQKTHPTLIKQKQPVLGKLQGSSSLHRAESCSNVNMAQPKK